MRIAVAADHNDATMNVSLYGGRAPFFLVFDEHGEVLESFANPYHEIDRHAGYEVSRLLAEMGIDIVIGGVFGPTMISELSARAIKCITKSGPARHAVLALNLENEF